MGSHDNHRCTHALKTYNVTVGVALRRPPKVDEYRKVIVMADSAIEARLVAAQISACTSVMPLEATIDKEGS